MLFRKYSRRTVGLAGFGLLVAVVVAVFLLSTDSYPNPPHELSTPMLVTILVLCPPSMLSALVIDAETGTSAFYFVWFFIALLNAVLYAAVGAAVAPLLQGFEITGCP